MRWTHRAGAPGRAQGSPKGQLRQPGQDTWHREQGPQVKGQQLCEQGQGGQLRAGCELGSASEACTSLQ